MEGPGKAYPTIGACGLDCGLCTRYYTVGKSRCPGCCGPDFFNKHPSCPFTTCCVKKKGLEVCGECPEYPCSRFKTQAEYEAFETSSYPPCRKLLPNLDFIKRHGIKKFVQQQRQRIELLEEMLTNFDDGRSRSFFCRAAGILHPARLEKSLDEANRRIKKESIQAGDSKAKAKVLRELITELAVAEGIELELTKAAGTK